MHRRHAVALAAALATALTLSACGPGDPPDPPPVDEPAGGGSDGSGNPGDGSGGGGSSDGGAGDAGTGDAGSGGGATPDTGGGNPDPGIPTAFAAVLGGAGDEWAQDVAAAPGGAVVALTVVGPRDDGAFDQLGLTRIPQGGRAEPGRLYDLGVPVRFPRDGALSVGPGGEIYLALEARCDRGCEALGGPFDGSALVQLAPGGDPRWTAALPGAVASQPAVDPSGNVAVATSQAGGAVVWSLGASGSRRWRVALPGAASGDVSLAADAGGNVIAARGDEVTKIGPDGAIAWSRRVGAEISGAAGTSSGVVVLAGTTPDGPVVLQLAPDGRDGAMAPLPGPAEGIRVEVGAGRRIGAVTGAGSCAATLTLLDVGGGIVASRPIATGRCEGAQLRVEAVTVTTAGVAVVAGAIAGTVDLGREGVSAQRTDALVAGFGP